MADEKYDFVEFSGLEAHEVSAISYARKAINVIEVKTSVGDHESARRWRESAAWALEHIEEGLKLVPLALKLIREARDQEAAELMSQILTDNRSRQLLEASALARAATFGGKPCGGCGDKKSGEPKDAA